MGPQAIQPGPRLGPHKLVLFADVHHLSGLALSGLCFGPKGWYIEKGRPYGLLLLRKIFGCTKNRSRKTFDGRINDGLHESGNIAASSVKMLMRPIFRMQRKILWVASI